MLLHLRKLNLHPEMLSTYFENALLPKSRPPFGEGVVSVVFMLELFFIKVLFLADRQGSQFNTSACMFGPRLPLQIQLCTMVPSCPTLATLVPNGNGQLGLSSVGFLSLLL